jgi:hypothetical protein
MGQLRSEFMGRNPDPSRRLAELGRTEAAARLSMASFAEDMLAPPTHHASHLYGWFSAGLAVAATVLGAVYLLGPQ